MRLLKRFLLLSCITALAIAGGDVKKTHLPLVDVARNPKIRIHCVYATPKNFTGKVVYSCPKCYLRPHVAQALDAVQQDLEQEGLGLLVWDAFRPVEAQEKFWEICPDPRYVSCPYVKNEKTGEYEVDRKTGKKLLKGGRHTRGTAVDVTLVDLKTGKTLEMPTEFDDFSEKAWSDSKDVSDVAKVNRAKLKAAMEKHKFTVLETEWWHFDYEGWQTESVLADVKFDDLVG